jgi:alpha-glucosidase (family GH31 glycosyl hydrolase)
MQEVFVLERGRLRVEVKLAPLRIHVRRDGRRLVRALRVWCADGESHDHLVRITEGVVARETRGFPERPGHVSVTDATDERVDLRLRLHGGRGARLSVAVPADEHVLVHFEADGRPLRLFAEWDRRDDERFNGLGARHHLRVDHAERAVQLGADRRYTGPDCPPDLAELGGIPQGDYAPSPWAQSSRGYAVWCETWGNGTKFELGEPVRVSVRSRTGPLRLHLLTRPSSAGRLRQFCGLTGFPALLPEWGYGFWKSRDIYDHQTDAEGDVDGCVAHEVPVDAVVLDSPWETQYNTWEPNPFQFPDFAGMVRRFRDAGVRTVVWVTPWVNVESVDGQVPPDPDSRRLHREPASTYAEGEREGHFVRSPDGRAYVDRWWMGTGSMIDFTSPAAERWWREQAEAVLRLGVEGIKADDGEGYYVGDDLRFADGSPGRRVAWRFGEWYRASMQRALDNVHGPGTGVLFGRSGWAGQQTYGHLWGGDQASDAWSLQALLAAALSAASSGFSNWSHDVGGYLGEKGLHRCSKELLVRWAQVGCFTPLMQAHGRLEQEPWTYDRETLEIYRGYVLLHEMLVPYIRAAAWSAHRHGLPVTRPLAIVDGTDEHGWTTGDAYGFGPSLWVAPVVEEGSREREVRLPRGRWIESWSGRRVRGGAEVVVDAPLARCPVWVREGALIVTYPAWHVSAGLGDTPESQRPLEATLWGRPACGRALARLADGTRVRWSAAGGWDLPRGREVATRVVEPA